MASTSFVEEIDSVSDGVSVLECDEVILLVLFDGTVRALSVEDGCEVWRVAPIEHNDNDDASGPAPLTGYEESLGDSAQRKGAFRLFKYLVPGLGLASKEVFMFDGRYLQRVEGLFDSGAPRFGSLHSTNKMKCDYFEVDARTGRVMAANVRDAAQRVRKRAAMAAPKRKVEGGYLPLVGQEGDVSRTLVITREAKENEGFEQSTGNSWLIHVNVVDVCGVNSTRPESTPPSTTTRDGSGLTSIFPEGALVPNTKSSSTAGALRSMSDEGSSFGESESAKVKHSVYVCVSGSVRLTDPSTGEVLWDVELDSPVTQAYLVSTPSGVNLRSCVHKRSIDNPTTTNTSVTSATDSSLDTSPSTPIPSHLSNNLQPRWVSRRHAASAGLQVTVIPVLCERPTAFPHSPVSPQSCTSSSMAFPKSPSTIDPGTSGSLVPSNGSPPSARSGGYFDATRKFFFIPNTTPLTSEADGFPRTESEMLADCYEVQGFDPDSTVAFVATPCSPVNNTPNQRGFLTRPPGKTPSFVKAPNGRVTSTFPVAPVSQLRITEATTTSPSVSVPRASLASKTPPLQTSPTAPCGVSPLLGNRFEFPVPSFLRQTYQLVGRLGKGGYGVVFLIKPYHANVTFALKAVFFSPGQIKTDEARRRILNEVEIAATIKSEHFLRPGNTWIEPVTPPLLNWLSHAPDLTHGNCEGAGGTTPFPAATVDSVADTTSDLSLLDTVGDEEYSNALRTKFFEGFTSSNVTSVGGGGQEDDDVSDSTSSSSSSSSSEPSVLEPPGCPRGPTPVPTKTNTHQLVVPQDNSSNAGALVVKPHSPEPFSLAAADPPKSTWSVVNASPARTPYILFLQMEFCPTTLTQWMHEKHDGRTPVEILSQKSYHRTALSISIQLFKALSVLQRRSLLHRDIKPSNLFLVPCSNELRCDDAESDDGEGGTSSCSGGEKEEELYVLKVGDFGLATCVALAGLPSAFEGVGGQRGSTEDVTTTSSPTETSRTKTGHNSCLEEETTSRSLTAGIGSPLYAAPEQWQGSQYGTKADVFSAGLVLIELFSLFDTASERIHVFNDVRRKGPSGLPTEFVARNPSLAAVIGKCVELLPSKRSSATQVLKCLERL